MTAPAGPRREDGRHLFGRDAAGYASHRPPYPDALWPLIDAYRAASGRHFEIGPGTGLATGHLLAAGSQLTAIEPDPGLLASLQLSFAPALDNGQLHLLPNSFEAAADPAQAFDAGHAATCFHWLEPSSALPKVRGWLRPGGAWAMWWNVFGDPRQPDEFALATAELFAPLAPNPSRVAGLPFALDATRRIDELKAAGFVDIAYHALHWEWAQTTAQVVGLTATFSPVACLPDDRRQRFLDALADRVERDFNGRVLRHFLTPLYLATAPHR